MVEFLAILVSFFSLAQELLSILEQGHYKVALRPHSGPLVLALLHDRKSREAPDFVLLVPNVLNGLRRPIFENEVQHVQSLDDSLPLLRLEI